MNTIDVLQILKERERGLKSRIARDRTEIKKLRYKSRRIRLCSPLNPRIGWFTDRLQELQLVVKLIEGEISSEDFIIHKNGDKLDKLITLYSDQL